MLQGLTGHKNRLSEVFAKFDPRALDLLSKMLALNPAQRPTASEALDHDYFWADPLPCKATEYAPLSSYYYSSCSAPRSHQTSPFLYTDCLITLRCTSTRRRRRDRTSGSRRDKRSRTTRRTFQSLLFERSPTRRIITRATPLALPRRSPLAATTCLRLTTLTPRTRRNPASTHRRGKTPLWVLTGDPRLTERIPKPTDTPPLRAMAFSRRLQSLFPPPTRRGRPATQARTPVDHIPPPLPLPCRTTTPREVVDSQAGMRLRGRWARGRPSITVAPLLRPRPCSETANTTPRPATPVPLRRRVCRHTAATSRTPRHSCRLRGGALTTAACRGSIGRRRRPPWRRRRSAAVADITSAGRDTTCRPWPRTTDRQPARIDRTTTSTTTINNSTTRSPTATLRPRPTAASTGATRGRR